MLEELILRMPRFILKQKKKFKKTDNRSSSDERTESKVGNALGTPQLLLIERGQKKAFMQDSRDQVIDYSSSLNREKRTKFPKCEKKIKKLQDDSDPAQQSRDDHEEPIHLADLQGPGTWGHAGLGIGRCRRRRRRRGGRDGRALSEARADHVVAAGVGGGAATAHGGRGGPDTGGGRVALEGVLGAARVLLHAGGLAG
jgi:hypothetical protein